MLPAIFLRIPVASRIPPPPFAPGHPHVLEPSSATICTRTPSRSGAFLRRHLHPDTLTFRSLPSPPFAPGHPHVPEPPPAAIYNRAPSCSETFPTAICTKTPSRSGAFLRRHLHPDILTFRNLPRRHLHPDTLMFRNLLPPTLYPDVPHTRNLLLHQHYARTYRTRNPPSTFHLPRVSRTRNPILQLLLNPGIQMAPIVSYLILRVSLSSVTSF